MPICYTNPMILCEQISRSQRFSRKILLKEKRCHSRRNEKCFIVKFIKLRNNLPEDLKLIRKYLRFKTRDQAELFRVGKLHFRTVDRNFIVIPNTDPIQFIVIHNTAKCLVLTNFHTLFFFITHARELYCTRR